MEMYNFLAFLNDVRCPVCILDAPSLWKRPHENPSSAAKKENLAFSTCIQERPIHHGRLGLIYQFKKIIVFHIVIGVRIRDVNTLITCINIIHSRITTYYVKIFISMRA